MLLTPFVPFIISYILPLSEFDTLSISMAALPPHPFSSSHRRALFFTSTPPFCYRPTGVFDAPQTLFWSFPFSLLSRSQGGVFFIKTSASLGFSSSLKFTFKNEGCGLL